MDEIARVYRETCGLIATITHVFMQKRMGMVDSEAKIGKFFESVVRFGFHSKCWGKKDTIPTAPPCNNNL